MEQKSDFISFTFAVCLDTVVALGLGLVTLAMADVSSRYQKLKEALTVSCKSSIQSEPLLFYP